MKITANTVLAFVLAAGLPAAYAESHDSSCRSTTYFADATMRTQVGSTSTCPGLRGQTGRTTRFAYTEIDVIEQPDPLAHPGSLPCEWPLECANESAVSAPRAQDAQKRAR